MSKIVVTVVANCRDIFFPVPFPPSPFGFRRLLRPPLSTFGAFPFSVNFPGLQLPNTTPSVCALV